MADADDVVDSFASPSSQRRATIKHPIAAFFHVFFRVTALLVYILASTLIGDAYFVHIFLTIVLLLAVDFWTVKNVTGRLLVGLRWWNKVDDDGTSTWMFESKKKLKTSQPEAVLFWGGLFLCPLFWILFFFTSLLRFSWGWGIIPVIGMALNGANAWGYIKCRSDKRAQLTQMAGQFLGKQILKQAVDNTFKTEETF
ncbi:Golgi apparatus membrane protein TVP23 homolog B-like [Halichondria panicea]|uniref:Golgi apparatus membrane protein TVP23 homolog B-like n=1 Tax=Halichondria panicea TaxID=6063 RepID=UPI00312B7816